MLSSSTIAQSLIRLHQEQTEKIEAFWIETSGSRQQLKTELTALFSGCPILVALVEKDRFDDPNGVCDELNLTIQENKDWFTADIRQLISEQQRFSLVLVSKRPLAVPQMSSPVELPDWFPQWPGQILTTEVSSVLSSITLSLASLEIPQAAINGALFDLERELCRRLQMTAQATPTAANDLMAVVGTGAAPSTLSDLIASSTRGLQDRSSTEFRPGGSIESGFIVSHLARVWRDCQPAQRQLLAAHAAKALGLNSASQVPAQYSLTSFLTRGKEKFPSIAAHLTFSRTLLGTVSDVVQFVNGIHHADEFPHFPAVLTITFAKDLVRSCSTAASALAQLP
jgi:hypothetical protein